MITGEYYRVFGIIKLEEGYIIQENISPEMNAAFLHESIHYIQDFGTLYGINMAVYRLSCFIEMKKQIIAGKFPEILQWDKDEDLVNSMFKWAQGDEEPNSGARKCHVINFIELQDNYAEYYAEDYPDKGEYFKPQVLIHYNDGKQFEFGGAAISENMAFLFEKIFFNSTDYNNDIPYNVCELLYEHVLNKKCENMSVMIAMCYASLMSKYPGYTFYELLLKLEQMEKIPTSMEQIFELAKDKMRNVTKGELDNLMNRIDMILPTEADNVMSQPIAKEYLENLKYTNNWLKERYREISQNEPAFRKAIVYILEKVESNKKRIAMSKLLEEYGEPLVIDKAGKLWNRGNLKLVFLLAPYALQELVMNKKRECALLEVCEAYRKKTTGECRTCCWKHADSNTICILRFYLYAMGLGATEFDKLEGSPFRTF